MLHICTRCKHKYQELMMQRVSLYDGEYTIWTPDRAAYFRSHAHKYPALVWLCGDCYSAVSEAQALQWATGEPVTPRPPAPTRPKKRHTGPVTTTAPKIHRAEAGGAGAASRTGRAQRSATVTPDQRSHPRRELGHVTTDRESQPRNRSGAKRNANL